MSLSVAASTQALSAEQVFTLLERVRQKTPRVHAITNAVAQSFTANVLLALGAVPSMTIAREEVAAFAGGADALGEKATLHVFNGTAGYHCQTGAGQELTRTIFAWLNETLYR